MDKADQELLLRVVPSDSRLKKLYNQHRRLEREVNRFELYSPYSSSAALRQRELKKEKLRAMECIVSILNEYRRHPALQH